jgi:hypothetical protein
MRRKRSDRMYQSVSGYWQSSGQINGAIQTYIGKGIYSGKVSASKKNCEGFLTFFTFENFKRAFLGDMK